MTSTELLEWAELTHKNDHYIIFAGPDLQSLQVERFDDVGLAAHRFFDLNQRFTPVVRVCRLTNGHARMVGTADHGSGTVSMLDVSQ